MLMQPSKQAIGLATLCAIFAMAGVARADDGGAEDYRVPAAFISGDGAGSDPVSCAELRAEAWFKHELERSDGEVSPAGEEPYCKPDIYAESTVDAD
jgi:hypothetical protein